MKKITEPELLPLVVPNIFGVLTERSRTLAAVVKLCYVGDLRDISQQVQQLRHQDVGLLVAAQAQGGFQVGQVLSDVLCKESVSGL